MKSIWLGLGIALALLIALFYLSSSGVQKLRADTAASTIQTG